EEFEKDPLRQLQRQNPVSSRTYGVFVFLAHQTAHHPAMGSFLLSLASPASLGGHSSKVDGDRS
ncbi:hypothetical protein, partial [Ralstonia solanacearum]|uniref:hypothetical protein n=1 Tax=Ralstonia solanacearum TaxID=305 RepID=UPI001A8F972D